MLRLSKRAVHSSFLRNKLKAALLLPDAASSIDARNVLIQWSSVMGKSEDDPLRKAWLEVSNADEWTKVAEIQQIKASLKSVVSTSWLQSFCNRMIKGRN